MKVSAHSWLDVYAILVQRLGSLIDEEVEGFGEGQVEVGWVSSLSGGVPSSVLVFLPAGSIAMPVAVLASQGVKVV